MSAAARQQPYRRPVLHQLIPTGRRLLAIALLLMSEGCAEILDPKEGSFGIPTDCGTTSTLSARPLACGATLSNTGRLTAEHVIATNGGAGGVGGTEGIGTSKEATLPLPQALVSGAALRFSGGEHGGLDCDVMELVLVPQSGPFSIEFLAPRGDACDGEGLAGPYEITEPTRLTFPAWLGDQEEWVLHFAPLDPAPDRALSLDFQLVGPQDN